jgi:hypothetical protein
MPLAVLESDSSSADNPIDLVEQIVAANEWTFERAADDELAVEIAGRWCDYRLFFAWREDASALHFSCAFDMRVPKQKRAPVHGLLAMVNEKMWLGHFDLWSEDGLPIFRHAMLLRGTSGATSEQIEDLVNVALSESERFYPAFQFVIWGGKSPEDAVAMALIDPVGEA